MSSILLVGHPNSGKTQLFNALTNAQAPVGNWSGVTVEAREEACVPPFEALSLIDLPGIYSLFDEPCSEDESIAIQTIQHRPASLIIQVIHACHLERQLVLCTELLELNCPMMVVVSMQDLAEKQGIQLDLAALSVQLNCPVVGMSYASDAGRKRVLEAMEEALLDRDRDASRRRYAPPQHERASVPAQHERAYVPPQHERASVPAQHERAYGPPQHERAYAPAQHERIALDLPPDLLQRYQQQQTLHLAQGLSRLQATFATYQHLLQETSLPDADLTIADARYRLTHQICLTVQQRAQQQRQHLTASLDRVFLNRFLGLPLFFAVMYALFFFAIQVGGVFQPFFDLASQALFIQGSAHVLTQLHAPPWLINLIANGLGKGLNTTLTFIPVLAALFFFLSFLENSGYMARVAVVMDRCMRTLGLPGKAFVPLIIGFGCNVPAILATRTLEHKRDRLLTALMAPFMSCSARLTIYTVFVSAFFPKNGQNVIFLLYLLGVLVAIATGFLLRRTMLPAPLAPLLIELPNYYLPKLNSLARMTWLRLRLFLQRAARLILPTCVILAALTTLSIQINDHSVSLLAYLGQQVTPLFAPMGLEPENWPAMVGLLTGILAKEVVIGSMSALYQQLSAFSIDASSMGIYHTLLAAWHSIPEQAQHLVSNQPAFSSEATQLNQLLPHYFHSNVSVYAYLSFILLYLPCISTMAAIRQEASSQLMWFSILWSFFMAYLVSVLVFQLGTFSLHPLSSLAWVGGLTVLLIGFIASMRSAQSTQGGRDAVSTA